MLASASPTWARGVPCLGSDPAAAGDASALAAIRSDVDAACPCAGFTAAGHRRRAYLRCAKRLIKAAVADGQLRKQCRKLATYPVVRSVCGFPSEPARVACVHTSDSGKVSCEVTKSASCAKSHGVACPASTNCRDAADTDHNLVVGPGDSGACDPPMVCLNPPLPDGTPCDDGDACTKDDACSGHACVGTAKPDGQTCDAGVDEARPLTCIDGTCASCTEAGACSGSAASCAFDAQCPIGQTCVFTLSPAPRFVDNGDGTVTDRQTCLVWEKKGAFDGSPVACPGGPTCVDPHDADNVYAYSTSGSAADGALFTDFLAGLNAAGFAGHADWRLPHDDLPKELASIVDTAAPGCGSGSPCTPAAFSTGCTPTCSGTDPACSCTAPAGYWYANGTVLVDFADGTAGTTTPTSTAAARAVRGCSQTLVAPSVKSRCVSDCSLGCGAIGACIYGCELGQINNVDQCYVECGADNQCLNSCLATVQCIADASAGYCP